MISINYRDPRPLYEQIKESIIKLIMTKSLKENEQLPSVRELAVELAINSNTIQRAYRELENEGYIYKITGKGTFVSPQEHFKPNTEELMENFREAVAKLLFAGESAESLKKEIEKIQKEVGNND
ncbi:MAG: GntR family transcriptional regulator [Eubacterium sp.]|nr:GntR family transcriptional regulator [Eubacterium sp.]